MAKARTDAFVVDASTLLVLVLPDTAARKRFTSALIDVAETGRIKLMIPQFCHAEMAGRITRNRRNEVKLSDDAVNEFIEVVEGLSIDIVVESYNLREICAFAKRVGCGGGDAIYLSLAKDMEVGIASLDGGMRQGAIAIRLPVFDPALYARQP